MNRKVYVIYSQFFHWDKPSREWQSLSLPTICYVATSVRAAETYALDRGEFVVRMNRFRLAKRVSDFRDLKNGKEVRLYYCNAILHTRYVLVISPQPLI